MPGQQSVRPIRWKIGRELFASAAVPINVNRHRINRNVDTHDHDFMEIALVVGGQGVHRSHDGAEPLRRGSCIVLRPGTWHAYAECKDLQVVNCCFGVELLRRELAWVLEDPRLNTLFWRGPLSESGRGLVTMKLQPPTVEECHHCMNQIAAAEGSRARQVGLLLLLLEELSKHVQPPRPDNEMPPPVHAAVTRGTRLLEERLAHDWSLEELAEMLRIDASYLSRLFKSATGIPPMAYLARCRAEQAASMLLRTARPVSEIAAEVGWSDPNYFARRFRAYFGLNATRYRERFRPA